jgi:hypothetical protein
MIRWTVLVLAFLGCALVTVPADACSLCRGDLQNTLTFRLEAGQPAARLILYGTLGEASLDMRTGQGRTKFHITHVLRGDKALGDRKEIDIPRYLTTKPDDPQRWLFFCDVFMGNRIDPYRGVPVQHTDVVAYLQKALALDPMDRTAQLRFYFDYLEHPEPTIATDAFLEFAKATDPEIGKVAPSLRPERLRHWIGEKTTPAERLGMYAYLLGACGNAEDGSKLRLMLFDEKDERVSMAYAGILSGYLHLEPREGWKLVNDALADGRRPLQQRLSIVSSVRFSYGTQPEKYRAQALQAFRTMLVQGELADLAVEDLRKKQLWDLTGEVLALSGRKGFDAPIMQRALLRYALSCPRTNAVADFIVARRKEDPELVKEVEDSLRFERKP